MEPLEALFERRRKNLHKDERSLLQTAYTFSKEAHKHQKRYSGEEYFTHVLRVAENVSGFGADAETIAAAFLHDCIEDCGVTKEELEKRFGPRIAFLVHGVSKLGGLKYGGRKRYAENMRHLFLALAEDMRVVLIKLADRLDNIRTLEHVPTDKRGRIALETLEIYAPLANRLGMGTLQAELEDRAFEHAHPDEYQQVERLVREKSLEREKYIKKVYKSVAKEVVKAGMSEVHLNYRIKNMYSVYKKLLKKNMDVAKVYDIYALRVIVPTIEACYRALGLIHNMWKPLPGRFKDYVANPKINGYQSLHTTVFIGDGGIAEIQIRTKEMQENAEYGIAAHLVYKERGVTRQTKKVNEPLKWVSQIHDLHKETSESEEFFEHLKVNFFDERVFIFTPKGDVIELPTGATALDFAYAVHTEIGNHTAGARVNGKLVSLDTELENGDIVEIQTRQSNHPTRKWLEYVTTGLARKSIRSFLNKPHAAP